MPDKITFGDALRPAVDAQGRITFDDAMAARSAASQPIQRTPGGAPMVPMGQELIPGEGLPGGPTFRPPAMMPRPEDATQANFGTALKAAIPADDQTKLRIIAGALFPNDPNGIKRVGLAEGRPVYVNDKGKLQLVSGPWSRMFAQAASAAPEMAGAVIGSFAQGQPITGAATGAAGGRAFKRGVSQLLFDEPATAGSVAKEMATEAGLTAVGGMLGKLGASAMNRGRIVDYSPSQMSAAEQTRALIKTRTGIDLDLAQASGDRMLLGLRDYAGKYPGKVAEVLQARDEITAGQLDAATNRVLNMVATAKPAEVAGKEAIGAAQAVIAATRRGIYEQVRPLYRAAYEAVPEVSDPQILEYMQLPYFKEAMRRGRRIAVLEGTASTAPLKKPVDPQALLRNATTQQDLDQAAKTLKLFEDNPTASTAKLESLYMQRSKEVSRGMSTPILIAQTTVEPGPSLRDLDYLKRGLDDKIAALKRKGSREETRALTMRRNEFVQSLDGLSNGQWQTARLAYAQGIAASVEPLENGMIGVLAKMHPKNAQTAARIFNDPSITPDQIAILKGGLTHSNPDAYRGLVRQWLAQKYNLAMRETQGAEVINPAGKFRQAVIGTPSQKANAKAMLPADATEVFDDLMMASEKLARTPLGASRVAGSPTASNQLITDALRGRALNTMKWILTPKQALRNEAERKAQEDGITALTEALIDPAKRAQLKMVAKMPPSQRQLILLAPILGTDIGAAYVRSQGMMGESVIPPVYGNAP